MVSQQDLSLWHWQGCPGHSRAKGSGRLPCVRFLPGWAPLTDLALPWQNILFLGDFNADCSYVRPQDWPSIRLRTSDAFQWLIPDSADTTVSYTDCAYDR